MQGDVKLMRIAGIVTDSEEAYLIEDVVKTYVTTNRIHKIVEGISNGRR